MRFLITVFSLGALFILYPHLPSSAENLSTPAEKYWPSSTCRDCHVKAYDQHLKSMHARAFVDPVFQAQYFKEVVPRMTRERELSQDAEGCIACHSPITYSKGKKLVKSKRDVSSDASGVTCDFCHTIKDFKDDKPGSGNYISVPAKQKLGPIKSKSNWHHTYSELHTKSEFCAICHNMTNRNGLEIKSTYTEWKNSPYAEADIQCQDCHMNAKGFLTEDKPVFESGKSSYSVLGYSPYREKLHTHRFPGAHSSGQLAGAIRLGIETSRPEASSGDEIVLKIIIDNSRTGHKMPTGSADLRFMYLEVNVVTRDKVTSIPVGPVSGNTGYDVTGFRMSDMETLGNDITRGMRVYRTIFVDKTGRPTLSSYEAVNIIFDNRIDACEIREENYKFVMPEDSGEAMTVEAKLYYVPYPASFAEKLELPKPEAFEISSAIKKLDIK
jgi:nitrate/TMAO reductase-like tetraheme cytochrome c subunit